MNFEGLLEHFEKEKLGIHYDREPESKWSMGLVYVHYETNKRFFAFRKGYELGKERT